MRKISKKLVVGTAATAIVAAGAGVAFAYWTTSGTGTGTATTGHDAGFTVDVTGPTGLVLDTAGTVAVKVTNNAAFKQQIHSVQLSITGIKDSQGHAITDVNVCNPNWFTVVDPTVLTHEIAANGDETDNGSVTLNNNASNQDGCKDVTLELKAVAS